MSNLMELLNKRREVARITRDLGVKQDVIIDSLNNLIVLFDKKMRSDSEQLISIMSAMCDVIKSIDNSKTVIPGETTLKERSEYIARLEKIELAIKEIKTYSRVYVENQPELKVPDKVTISDKKPAWWKDADPTPLVKSIAQASKNTASAILDGLVKLTQDVIIKNKEPKDAIPVCLVDSKKKGFYNAEGGKGGAGLIISDGLSYGKGLTKIEPISISDEKSEYVLPAGKKYLLVQNTGSSIVAFGDADVGYSDSPQLTPKSSMEFIDLKPGFKVYFISDTGKTSKITGLVR